MLPNLTYKLKAFLAHKKELNRQKWFARSLKLCPIRNNRWYVSNAGITRCVEGIYVYYAAKRDIHYSDKTHKNYKKIVHICFYSNSAGSALRKAVKHCESANKKIRKQVLLYGE